jgi:hypothetical protein
VAVIAAVALYSLLPGQLIVGPRYTVPVLELLLIPLLAINPRRLTRETRWSRRVATGLVLLIAAANQVALVLLLEALTVDKVSHGARKPATERSSVVLPHPDRPITAVRLVLMCGPVARCCRPDDRVQLSRGEGGKIRAMLGLCVRDHRPEPSSDRCRGCPNIHRRQQRFGDVDGTPSPGTSWDVSWDAA